MVQNQLDWEEVRINAAIAVMPQCIEAVKCVLIQGGNLIEPTMAREASRLAVEYADALMKELQKKEG